MTSPKHEPFEFDNEWDQLVSKIHSRITQLRDAPAEERQQRHDQVLAGLYELTALSHWLVGAEGEVGYWKGIQKLHRGEIRVVDDEGGSMFRVEAANA